MTPEYFFLLLFATAFFMFVTAYFSLERFRFLIDILFEYFVLLCTSYGLKIQLAYLKLKYRILVALRKMLIR